MNNCIICTQPLNTKLEMLIRCPECVELFHYKCIQWWYTKANSCPLCKQQEEKNWIYVYD